MFRLVHDRYSWRRLESKQGVRQGQVLLPVSKPVFQLYPSGLENADIRQFAGPGVDLQQDLVELLVKRGQRVLGVAAARAFTFGLFAPRTAKQNDVSLHARRLRADIKGLAKLRKLGLAGQQGKGRTPVCALLDRSASYGVVGGNVKPDRLTIGDEELLFRRLIFPAHSARPAEIHGSRLGLHALMAIAVSLEKNGLEGARIVIVLFESVRGGGGAGTYVTLDGQCESDKRKRAG